MKLIDWARKVGRTKVDDNASLDILLAPHLGHSGTCGTRNLIAREMWLEKTVAGIPSGSRILDAGAGEMKYKQYCAHLNYVSQDFAQYDGMGDGTGLQTGKWHQSHLDIVSDITRIPEPDASFDAVMCIEVLEHLPNPIDALRELHRLLKSGGKLILTAPFCCLTHMAPYFYQTGFSRYFYEYWFRQFGFHLVELELNGNFFEFLAQEIRRLPDVAAEYADGALSDMEKKAQEILLGALNRFSQSDQGSERFLSYGLHVLGRKL